MTPAHTRLQAALDAAPLLAILRGITPAEIIPVSQALWSTGLRAVEVPLNSPDPFVSIALLVQHFGERMVVGAGTVRTVQELEQLAATGASLAVSPHTDPTLIGAALGLGLLPIPGFQTATEAFAALGAGAQWLKLFPAGGRAGDLAALRAVLPPEAKVLAVGGVSADTIAAFQSAGATGFGAGSELYRPGRSAGEVAARASTLLQAVRLQTGPQAGLQAGPQASQQRDHGG